MTDDVLDLWLLITTVGVLSRMKDEIQDSAVPHMPNDVRSLPRRMSWSTVSKAADMSNIPRRMSPEEDTEVGLVRYKIAQVRSVSKRTAL